jgi:hypothetical protein
MTQATDTDIREIKDLIAAGNLSTQKQIADLAISNQKQFADLREEMRVGFSKVEGQINTVEAKLEGKIDAVEAKIEGKIDKVDAKYEERTKLGFWGFIFRGSALAVLAAILVIFVKYLFPILPTELPKL